MAGVHRARKAVKKFSKKKADELFFIPAVLGFLIGGRETVEVSGRRGYVWARIRDKFSEPVQAFNDTVSPVYGLPVLLVRDKNDPTHYKVYSRNVGRYQDWATNSPYLPRHGNQHSFVAGGGGDVVWVYGQQFMPALVTPSGTYGSNCVLVYPFTYNYNFAWKYYSFGTSIDLLTYKPTGTSARMILIYLDRSSNALGYEFGSFFSAGITGTNEIIPYTPDPNSGERIPLAGIRLLSGTSSIIWDNIYDLRPFFTAVSSSGTVSGGGVGGSGTIIGDTLLQHVAYGGLNNSVQYDLNYFYYETGDAAGNSRLIIGDNALPYSSSSRLAIMKDGGSVGLNVHSWGGIPLNSAFASRGTKASPTKLLLDDSLSWWSLGGYDSAGWIGAKAIIKGRAAEDWSTSARGTYWEILATRTGTNSTVVGLRIDADRSIFSGDVIISGTVYAFASNITGSTGGGGGGSAGSGTAMYMLAGVPISMNGLPTSLYWKVPGGVYSTGTLSIFVNGVSQLLGIDYQSQYPSSGTYQLLFTPPTGSVHFAVWGVDKTVGGLSTITYNTVSASEIIGVQIFS